MTATLSWPDIILRLAFTVGAVSSVPVPFSAATTWCAA
jgi:hypothetical protein